VNSCGSRVGTIQAACTRSTRSSQIESGQQAELPHRGQVLAAPPSKTVLH